MKIIIFFLLLSSFLMAHTIKRIPHTSGVESGRIISLDNNTHLIFYVGEDKKLNLLKTVDNGLSWVDNVFTNISLLNYTDENYSIIKTINNNLILVYTSIDGIYMSRSTNFGYNWTDPVKILSLYSIVSLKLTETKDGVLWLSFRNLSGAIRFIKSTNGGTSWSAPANLALPPGSEILSINSFGDGKYCALVQVVEQQNRNILISYSTNQGTTWSGYQPLANSNLDELNPFFITTQDGKSRVIYNLKKPTPFSDHFPNDVFYMETADNGLNWSVPKQITKAVSDDYVLSVSSYGTVAQVLFKTNRASDANIKSGYQLAFSVVDENIDLSQPPHVYSVSVDLHSPAQ